MQNEGSLSAESAHEEAKLKNYIVTGAESVHGSGLHQIVRREDQHREIEARQCIRQTFDKRLPQCEDAFIPECDLRVVLERGPNRPPKFQTFRR